MELGSIGVAQGRSLYGSNAIGELVATASRKPLERLSQQAESTRVQLSAYGQLKSATAEVETAAERLKDNARLGSAADAGKAVQAFAEAINVQSKASRQDGLAAGASRPASEVRRAVEGLGGSNVQALRQIGLGFGQDGSLRVDAKTFEKAYQANPDQVKTTLNLIGRTAAETADRQLSETGSVGVGINRLNERLGNIQRTQVDYQARLQQSQRTVEEQGRRFELALAVTQQAFAFNGIGAYARIFSS